MWSIVAHLDRYIISKRLQERGVGVLLLSSSLFSIFIVPIIFLFTENPFSVPLIHKLVFILIGFASLVAVALNLYALEEEEASIVVPFMQLIPAFGYFFGFILLRETLSSQQLLAFFIVLLGILILSFEVNEEKKIHFKKRLTLLMLFSAILFAFYETVFKKFALNIAFSDAVFWEHIGLVLAGVFLFIYNKKMRRDFLDVLNRSGKKTINIIALGEIMVIIGNITFNFVSLAAPIALVFLVDSFQPMFVFFIGILLTIFFPNIIKERFTKFHIIQKIAAIVIIFIGTYLLY